jgi:hypothetical protein
MMWGGVGSLPRATPGRPWVSRLTHRIWAGNRTRGRPRNEPASMAAISSLIVDRRPVSCWPLDRYTDPHGRVSGVSTSRASDNSGANRSRQRDRRAGVAGRHRTVLGSHRRARPRPRRRRLDRAQRPIEHSAWSQPEAACHRTGPRSCVAEQCKGPVGDAQATDRTDGCLTTAPGGRKTGPSALARRASRCPR